MTNDDAPEALDKAITTVSAAASALKDRKEAARLHSYVVDGIRRLDQIKDVLAARAQPKNERLCAAVGCHRERSEPSDLCMRHRIQSQSHAVDRVDD